jgi:uncharacterized protein YjdB
MCKTKLKPTLFLALIFFTAFNAIASEIINVLPLTNKIILVHFDDGSVTYPNALKVNRLNVAAADKLASWSFASADDADFMAQLNPSKIGRKSKGTEFVKDAKWGGNSYDPRLKEWASEHWIYLVFDKEMKPGKNYSLKTGNLATNGSEWNFVFDEKKLRSEAVHVNTLGYDSKAPKFGYVYQWMGSLGNLDLTAFIGKKFWIVNVGTAQVVKEGTLTKRKSATNPETSQSNDTPNKNFLGADVAECDFSDVTAEGTYQLVVEGMGASYPFKIGKDAIWDAYYNVARGLYHQRSGIRLAPPYTAAGYIRPVNQNTKITSDDGTSFAGKLLYSDYDYMNWENADNGGSSEGAIRAAAEGKTLDVAGWYHDAGDWDSYQSHQRVPMILMATWEFAPDRFADNELNIPESGNGIPDLIDEASWLIKFNYRLRKELKAKSYSDGGVGGARVCADVYTSVDGSSESSLPSWKEKRRTVVTKADAYMTYMYAGEAAQLAVILKKIGKDPKKFPVEMLDAIEFADMTKDTVNWVTEAEEAYVWASAPANQPASGKNYDSPLAIYKMYAAANLFRLTGKEEYNTVAKNELAKLQLSSPLTGDKRWGAYSYVLSDNAQTDKNIQSALKTAIINTGNTLGVNSANNRACRWGGDFSFPMLVGQATTPAAFETMIAACVSGEKIYDDVVHTTADYFLGSNPLHTSWITGVGPRPAACGFHLDTRYNNNWVTYPGFIPYGPWSMAYDYNPYTWVIDGVSMQGGHGPWNKDWANFSMYPLMENWPGHERWNSNIHSPMSAENTIHQNTVYGAVTYGFVNSRHYENSTSEVKVNSISLDKAKITLTKLGANEEITATLDENAATFPALKWTSSDPRIAHVDALGRVSGVTSGTCTITCSTLDGSVSASAEVTCVWDEIAVTAIEFVPDSFSIFKGQTRNLQLIFTPENATNKFVNYTVDKPEIVSVDENGKLTALAKGEALVTATSLSGKKNATCKVTVNELVDYVIADFDEIIPVTTEPQVEVAQLYSPDGTNDIAFANPMKNASNPSSKVVKWGRPGGDWRLIGMVLPTGHPQDLSRFTQFQFKHYGKDIKDFYIQLKGKNGQIEINENVEGFDCWRLFTYDLSSTDSLLQFNIFANKMGNPAAINCLFDDFKLVGESAVPFDGMTISESLIELNKGNSFQLIAGAQGNPFSWVSSDLSVATVDQNGKVTAVGGGITKIKAVPLYGKPAECTVKVEGVVTPVYKEEVFLDFETIELDWTAGYGSFSWNTDKNMKTDNPQIDTKNPSAKVFKWTRDIAGGNLWGGFGIVLPTKNTSGWERISFQVLVDKPVTTIRFELSQGETIVGEFIASNLSIAANVWTKVEFDLADLDMVNKTFDKVGVQIAGGSDLASVIAYTDNFKFEKGIWVSAREVSAEKTSLSVYPNPAGDRLTINADRGLKQVEFYSISGKKMDSENVNGEKTFIYKKNFSGAGMFFIRATDLDGNVFNQKIVFN